MNAYCYFRSQFMPLAEAKVGIVTHALNYGTGCFEGIRGNWNAEQQQLYLFRLRDHFERLARSCRVLKIQLPDSPEALCELTVELCRRNGFREDVYVRPLAFKGSEAIGVRLHDLQDDFALFAVPFGNYHEAPDGLRCGTVSWRRVPDLAIPTRAKVTGIYVNSALARTEAHEHGYDEAIMLTKDDYVCEGSGENIFAVIRGQLVTPDPSQDILVGITRDSVIQLARDELGIPTIERSLARNELYVADEVFMTGTAAHVSPVIEIDHRPIGTGAIGPITARLRELYFQAIYGRHPKYLHWCTPVYPAHTALSASERDVPAGMAAADIAG
ncbi:MAG: branched-chain amino acid transaminase [Chloroflexi bacterium]|jgi:branched-chain amino acid aminotransferase|nr:branched-chain amino acid transaminase [Chloroflexota bacterium]